MGGTPELVWTLWSREISLAFDGNSCYTDWAIPAYKVLKISKIINIFAKALQHDASQTIQCIVLKSGNRGSRCDCGVGPGEAFGTQYSVEYSVIYFTAVSVARPYSVGRQDGAWMVNWKASGRNRSWPNRSVVRTFSWRNWVKPRKISTN
jgi:hypothetical protein